MHLYETIETAEPQDYACLSEEDASYLPRVQPGELVEDTSIIQERRAAQYVVPTIHTGSGTTYPEEESISSETRRLEMVVPWSSRRMRKFISSGYFCTCEERTRR
jgi:hypothetical protein